MTLPKHHCHLRVGDIVNGRYCILRFVGEGSTGLVFAARHLQTSRVVAIKLLHTALVSDRVAIERFRRETEVTMRFSCEYIARTLDVGQIDGAGPFMVMEYLEGSDIAKLVERGGPLAIDRAIEFALQVCVALGHAHGQGIVHRDIKPANLAVVRAPNGREQIKVLDFGISKSPTDEAAKSAWQLTGNAVRLGTPMYVSPEQRTNASAVDERADIWSLGVSLFEMLAGVVPFDASPASLRDFNEPPTNAPSVSRYRNDVPKELDRVIAACLQRAPGRRYPNVGELADALSSWAPAWSEVRTIEVWTALNRSRLADSGCRTASASLSLARNDTLVNSESTLGPERMASPMPQRSRIVRYIAAPVCLCVIAGSFSMWWQAHAARERRIGRPNPDASAAASPSATTQPSPVAEASRLQPASPPAAASNVLPQRNLPTTTGEQSTVVDPLTAPRYRARTQLLGADVTRATEPPEPAPSVEAAVSAPPAPSVPVTAPTEDVGY